MSAAACATLRADLKVATSGVSAGSFMMGGAPSPFCVSASGSVVVLSPEQLLPELEKPAVASGSAKCAAVRDECTV